MWSFRRLSIWSEPRKLRLRSFSVPRRDQMNSHKNASLTPKARLWLLGKIASLCPFSVSAAEDVAARLGWFSRRPDGNRRGENDCCKRGQGDDTRDAHVRSPSPDRRS